MEAEYINPTDLNLTFTPPAIQGFDYAGLTEWAENISEKYHGLVVTEDQVVGIKSEMAHLNATKKKLDDARKEAVKLVSAPIKEFEAQIKSVCAIFDTTYAALGEQVKNHENAAREVKRQEVLFAIQELTAEAGYPGLEIPVQDSWLNKTQKPKATADAIKAIIADHIKAEKDAAALEQAKQDRAVAIEQYSAARADEFGFAIPASQFLRLQNLELPMVQVHSQITAAYTARESEMARQNVAPVPPTVAQAAPAASPMPSAAQAPTMQPTATPGRKILTLALEYDPAREGEINQLVRHLETLCASLVRLPGVSGGFPTPSQPQAAQRVRDY